MTNTDSSQDHPPKRRSRFLRRFLYTVAILVGLYLVIGFFVLPPVLKKVAVSQTSAHLRATLDLESVSFNPLTLRLAVGGVALREENGDPVFELATAEVDAAWSSLFRLAPVLKSIVLTEPTLFLIRDADGQVNVERILPEPDPREEKPDEPFALPRMEIHQFAISGGDIRIEDRSPDKAVAVSLEPITFSLDGFSTLTGQDNTLTLEALGSGGGRITHNGSILLDPLGAEGVLTITDLLLDQGSPYLNEPLNVEITGARLSLELAYQVNAADLTNPLITATLAHLELAETGIRELNADEPFFQLALLRVGETRLTFPEVSAEVSSVRLEEGRLRAARLPDGTIDLMHLLPQKAAAETAMEETAEPHDDAFAFLVKTVEIHDFEAGLEDRSLAEPAAIRAGIVSLKLDNLSHDLNAAIPVEGAFSLEGDTVLRLRGEAVPEPLRGEFDLELDNLSLPLINPWLGDALPLAINRGRFSTAGTVTLAMGDDGAPVLRFTGGSRLEEFQLTDMDGTPLLAWEDLSLEEAVFTSLPPKFEAGLLHLTKPHIDVIMDADGNLNLTKGLLPDDPAEPAEVRDEPAETPADTAFAALLAQLRIEDARIRLRDQSVSPEFSLLLDPLQLELGNVSTDPSSRSTVNLSSRVDRSSDLRIEGEISPMAADVFTDLRVRIDGYNLPALSPYTGRHIGRALAQGRLNLDADTRIEDRSLDAGTSTVFDQLRLGDRVDSPDAISLPLDLALSILRDRRGQISLDLPISGDLDDPQFSIAGIITQTLSNVVTRIAAAPFSMLGSLFGGRGEELSFISFTGGSANLSTDARSKLEELATILHERPALNLEIEGRFFPDADATALARLRLGEAVMAYWEGANGRRPENAREALEEDFLTAYYFHRFPPAPAKEPEFAVAQPPAQSTAGEETDPQPSEETGPPPVPGEETAEQPAVSTEAAHETFFGNLRRRVVASSVLERERSASGTRPEDEPEPPSAQKSEETGQPDPERPADDALKPELVPPAYAEMKQRLLETITVSDEDLLALAKEREETVRDYLLSTEKVEGERLTAQGGASGSGSEVHFGLQ